MSNSGQKITTSITVQENSLTPKAIEIVPGGTAGTKTTITSTQTGNISIDLKHLDGVTDNIDTTYVRVDTKGVANGVASLDVSGRIPNSQLPVSAMEFKGNWNAATNTPTLSDGGAFSAGDVYRVNVAGTQDLGSGSIIWQVGDWAVYNGTIWEEAAAPGSVTSVFGRTGDVIAQSGDYTKSDVGLGNVDNTSDVNKPVSTAQQTAIEVRLPAGVILPYGGSSAPSGYLLCDGTAVSRTTYATLFAAIGISYGAGDLSTTFNLPDFRGHVPIGAGLHPFLATTYFVGSSIGAETHTLTEQQMPYHTHVQQPHSHRLYSEAGGSLVYLGESGGGQVGGVAGIDNGGSSAYYDTTIPDGNKFVENTTAVNDPAGGLATVTQAHNNMQPSLGVNYIIRT